MKPTKAIKKPARKKPVIKNKNLNFYNKDELNEFMSALQNNGNYRTYVYFRLLAFTGMRIGESLALEWSDIDFEKQTLHINKTVSRNASGLHIQTPKISNSIRRISLDDNTIDILKEFKKDSTNGLIFQSEDGEILSPADLEKWYLAAIKKLPNNFKRISINGFRHTHAFLLFEAGASIEDVQKRLGRSSIEITLDIYAYVTQATTPD